MATVGHRSEVLQCPKDVEFPDTPALWPDKEVTELVNAFRNTFPKQTRLAAQVVTTIVVVIQKEGFSNCFQRDYFVQQKMCKNGVASAL